MRRKPADSQISTIGYPSAPENFGEIDLSDHWVTRGRYLRKPIDLRRDTPDVSPLASKIGPLTHDERRYTVGSQYLVRHGL
jgi:hypothetical protein